MSLQSLKTAKDFFYEHAGFSYGGSETPEQGRLRCALTLARAEQDGTAAGLVIEWEHEQDPDTSWLDQKEYTQEDRDNARMHSAIVRLQHGAEILASLGNIHEDTRRSDAFETYKRVVRAELFSEALAELERTR